MNVNLGSTIQINILPGLSAPVASLLIALVVLAIGFSIRHSYQRLFAAQKGRFILVSCLNVVAGLALIAVLSEININRPKVEQGVLITSGSDTTLLSTYAAQGSNDPVWITQAALNEQLFADKKVADWLQHASVLSQPEQLLMQQPDLQHLNVIGDGLTQSQWDRFKIRRTPSQAPLSIAFIPSPIRTGLINLNWHRQRALGQQQNLSGSLQVAAGLDTDSIRAGLYEIRLLDPTGNEIGRFSLRNTQHFQFTFTAKQIGRWEYQLQLFTIDGDTPVSTEVVAFEVKKAPLPRLLIKQSSPSFETRHLQNWAAQMGAQITIETQISQQKYISQYFNDSDSNNSQPNRRKSDALSLLQKFDLMLIDGRALLNLTTDQLLELQQAVSQGLGLVILADNSLINAGSRPTLLDHFRLNKSSNATDADLIIWPDNQSEQVLPYLSAVLSNPYGKVLVSTARDQAIVVAQQFGLGQVAVSLNNQTFQWRTSAQNDFYSRYWQYLFTQLSRVSTAPFFIPQASDGLPTVNQPSQLCVANYNELPVTHQPAKARYNGTKQTPIELILTTQLPNSDVACSVVFPQKQGWNKAQINTPYGVLSTDFYVYQQQQWSPWRQHNKHLSSQQIQQQTEANPSPQPFWKVLSKLPFWFCLMVFYTLLWIERKF